jgi:hypothetical protein
MKLDKWREAETVLRKLVKRLDEMDRVGEGYRMESRYWAAHALMKQDKILDALAFAKKAAAGSQGRNLKQDLEGPFDDYADIRTGLEELTSLLKDRACKDHDVCVYKRYFSPPEELREESYEIPGP